MIESCFVRYISKLFIHSLLRTGISVDGAKIFITSGDINGKRFDGDRLIEFGDGVVGLLEVIESIEEKELNESRDDTDTLETGRVRVTTKVGGVREEVVSFSKQQNINTQQPDRTDWYYTNYTDAAAMNGNAIAYQANSWVLGDPTYMTGSITPYTSWRIAVINGYNQPVPTAVYQNGFDLATLNIGSYGFYVYPSAPCFLEGTEILCNVDGKDVYVPIEKIEKGTLVKTSLDGYKKALLIGKGEIKNPADNERTENRLYKCSPSKYRELSKDVYMTGCHSILVDHLTEQQREQTIKQLGKIFVTSKKYRLMACIDDRAEPFNSADTYTIYHIALESDDEGINYGIYAAGLLVESCSISFLKKKSNMKVE
jgi:hypothetical protein